MPRTVYLHILPKVPPSSDFGLEPSQRCLRIGHVEHVIASERNEHDVHLDVHHGLGRLHGVD